MDFSPWFPVGISFQVSMPFIHDMNVMVFGDIENKRGKFLSVSFNGDGDYWGTGKLRTAPTNIILYFATLRELEDLFKSHFKILERKLIKVPEKGEEGAPTNYFLMEKL